MLMPHALQELTGRLREQRERLLLEPNLRLPTWALKARQMHYKVRSNTNNAVHASESERTMPAHVLGQATGGKAQETTRSRSGLRGF